MLNNSLHELTVAMNGRFELTAVKVDGSGSRKLAEFDNLILDIGLDRFCSIASPEHLEYVRVGSGSTAPNASQTRLVSQISGGGNLRSSEVLISSGAPYWFSRKQSYRFEVGAAAGNIAEVGVGWAADGDTLFSRALVLDQNGNPTTVSVLSDEFLDVSYTLICYPSAEDSRSTLTLAGSSYEVVARLSNAGIPGQFVQAQALRQHPLRTQYSAYGYAGEIGPLTGEPQGSVGSVSNPAIAIRPYAAGSFIAEVSITFGLADMNIAAGIRSLKLQPYGFCQYQIQFTPAVPKTNSQVFTIRFRLTFTRR